MPEQIDPVFGFPAPNPFVLLDGSAIVYPGSPARVDRFLPVSGEESFSVSYTYDRHLAGTVSGGKLITPTQQLIGVPRLWRKGYTGHGVKVCVIDVGYTGAVAHQAISISGGDGLVSLTDNHTTQLIGIVAARNNENSGMLGIAYDASVYVATLGDHATSVRWALTQGCRVIVISSVVENTENFRSAVRDAHYAGAVVILAAGQTMGGDTEITQMQPGCEAPWTISVGSTFGGGPMAFADTLYHKQILPYGNKGLDFALPNWTIAPVFDLADGLGRPVSTPGHDNSYTVVGGTSYTAPQVAGLFALLMEKYPRLSGRAIYHMLKRNGRQITSNGVTTVIPNLSFLR